MSRIYEDNSEQTRFGELAAEKTSVPGMPIATFAGEVKTVLI
tara:strand:+ start:182 stop:307 length:126 start_codon:yes stop_codon:yes gene_type:complete